MRIMLSNVEWKDLKDQKTIYDKTERDKKPEILEPC